MLIQFDATKNNTNMAKHGISLQLAEQLEWDWLQAKVDKRLDYGEPRIIGYAPVGNRVYCVVFVDRDDARRIISLRKANMREVRDYAKQT